MKGKLTHETYPSPGHVTPANENYLVVYTPPNYDPARAKPYPTFYLSHGGGENEMGWSTQGALGNILDNLINTGEIQPVVVVMPNGMGFPQSTFNEAYDQDLINNMIPYVEQHYHVSKSAMDRAFSGLSMGGMLTNSFIIKHPEVFQYYGMMSAGLPPAVRHADSRADRGAQGQVDLGRRRLAGCDPCERLHTRTPARPGKSAHSRKQGSRWRRISSTAATNGTCGASC